MLLVIAVLLGIFLSGGCKHAGGDSAVSSVMQPTHSKSVRVRIATMNLFLQRSDKNAAASADARLHAFPKALAATHADIIFVQELWSADDRAFFEAAMTSLGYRVVSKDDSSLKRTIATMAGYSGLYSNGLAIFVRLQFAEILGPPRFVEFSDTLNYDNYAHKGVLSTTIRVPGLGTIDLVTTQTSYRNFDRKTGDFTPDGRQVLDDQIRTILTAMDAGTGTLKIFGGDLNTHPFAWQAAKQQFSSSIHSEVYQILLTEGHLADAIELAKTPCWPRCATWSNTKNTQIKRGLKVSGGPDISGYAPDSQIDYVMLKPASRLQSAHSQMILTQPMSLEMQDDNHGAAPPEMLHLSDHFGWLVELELTGGP